VIAAKAVAFKEALEPEFGAYIGRVCENAVVLASSIAQSGARIVSGGTDTHLALVDLSPLGISGREAETWLDRANITVNKNSIPSTIRALRHLGHTGRNSGAYDPGDGQG
jgi:glycine hydroxymethyltransferase